jgi:hypothetical protein
MEWQPPRISHGICPQCALTLEAELEAAEAPEVEPRNEERTGL